MKKKFSNEAKIGLVTVLSLTMLYIGVNYMKGINLFKPANYYYVSCANVYDITISSPIYVEGFKVGLVRDIEYDYSTVNRITMEIRLDKGMKINKGSYISIESTLLSGAELHIKLNKYVNEYYAAGDTIEARMKTGIVAEVEEKILPGVNDMLPKIDSILTGLQTLMNSQALMQSIDNLQNSTKSLETSMQKLNVILGNDIPAITTELKTTSQNLSLFSYNINRLELEQSIKSLNSALENIDTLTARLNAKDNSLGLLLNDTLLYNNFNRTLNHASGLLLDFQQNPKRYVRFSLF
ncbi:MAG: MlaD family protein [Tannerella sp.]|nr:MlaD family protein [Tannerella sp.]